MTHQVCFHEAGHILVARVLLGKTPSHVEVVLDTLAPYGVVKTGLPNPRDPQEATDFAAIYFAGRAAIRHGIQRQVLSHQINPDWGFSVPAHSENDESLVRLLAQNHGADLTAAERRSAALVASHWETIERLSKDIQSAIFLGDQISAYLDGQSLESFLDYYLNDSPLADAIVLEDHDTWPDEVIDVLRRHREIFIAKVEERASDQRSHDAAEAELVAALAPYALRAWRCCRLTLGEIDRFRMSGIPLNSGIQLLARIANAEAEGHLTASEAQALSAKHSADAHDRANRLPFFAAPPAGAHESGVRDFFTFWGGEALYNHHEHDSHLGPLLRRTGTPVIIEANLPIAKLESPTSLAGTFVYHYASQQGCEVSPSCLSHDAHLTVPLPAEALRPLIYGEPRFAQLTGVAQWRQALAA